MGQGPLCVVRSTELCQQSPAGVAYAPGQHGWGGAGFWWGGALPGRDGSTQGNAAVGKDVPIAVGVVVVFTSLIGPRSFNLQGEQRQTHAGPQRKVTFRPVECEAPQ